MKIAICDDQINELEKINQLVEEYCCFNKYKADIYAYSDVNSLMHHIDDINCLILDVLLYKTTGLEVARQIFQRNKDIKIRLTEDELSKLNMRVSKSGYSRERYLRTLISGKVPKELPPIEYQKLIKEFNAIGNNLNQLVRNSYNNPIQNEVITVLENLQNMIVDLDKVIKRPSE